MATLAKGVNPEINDTNYLCYCIHHHKTTTEQWATNICNVS